MTEISNKLSSSMKSVMSFIAPFLRDYLQKNGSEQILGLPKGVSYGQGGISLGFILSNVSAPSFEMAGLVLIFPVFLVLGIVFGVLAIGANKNEHLLSVLICCLLAATLAQVLCVFIILLSSSFWLGVIFVAGILLSINVVAYVLKTSHEIKKENH